ncbi:MAG TPA: 1-acyl-sn-glycerol-3-phosphate acyltransferase [Lachnospiraceae bacterium]|nr:1-acyl-sn-glycerol-3-phosphate acyltransferase [Lachnospiraceae bacterium]
MLKTAIWWTRSFISLSLYLRRIAILKYYSLTGQNEKHLKYAADSVTLWGKRRLKAAGVKVEVKGAENIPDKKGILFVSNHQSDFDILVLLGYIPVEKGFVAKKELSKIPLLSRWMRTIHCLFIDRSDMKQQAKTIVDGIKLLKEGKNMVIFPEGTRSKGGPRHEFKAGSFRLATKSNAPIVPVSIDGSYKAFEANPHGYIRPCTVKLTIHKPIFTENLTKEELNELPKKVEQIVFSEVKENK